jgi:chorismate mutase
MPAHDPCILSHSLASPDEYPFTSNLPNPVLPPLVFPKILHPNKINANPSILLFYTRAIAPRITRHATRKCANGISGDEDDGNYGSAATIDVEVLHAISKRVHYGMRIAATHVRVDDSSRYRQICFGIKVPGESQRVYTAYS